jgi:type 1 glutamine amidotransferase
MSPRPHEPFGALAVKQLVAIFAIAVFAQSASVSATEDAPAGFVSLFNGKDFTGWKVPEGDGGHWQVIDGVIDYDAGSEAKGDKSLWSEREYGDFDLQLDWRLKEAPFINKSIPYILPDGTHAKDTQGKELRLALPDADSGVFLRGNGDYQVNIWCWPIGSGEMYTIRMDPKTAPELRAAVTPRTRADKPVGEWNHFDISVRGQTVSVKLNGKLVIPRATIPQLPMEGKLALQHHGSKARDGAWAGPPSLVQFRNIYIKEYAPGAGFALPLADPDAVKALVIAGGHEHETSFYSLFAGYTDLARIPVMSSAMAFQKDLRGKYDVIVMYDFSRELDETGRKNLRDFVESGTGVVVLHHALLNYQDWTWWNQDVVGGSYRLKSEGSARSSAVKNDQRMHVNLEGSHAILSGLKPFEVIDETYKFMRMSPKIHPLLSTDNPESDKVVAWVGPGEGQRVVAIQLGHGPSIFRHPSYRELVHNAILWSAGRSPTSSQK